MLKVFIFLLLLLSHGMLIPMIFLLLSSADGTNNIEARYLVQISAVGTAVGALDVVLVEVISMV